MRNFIVMFRNRCLFSLSLESRNVTLKGPRAVSLKQENPRVLLVFLPQDFYWFPYKARIFILVFLPQGILWFSSPGLVLVFFFQDFHSLLVFLPQDFLLVFFPRSFIGFPPPGFLLVFFPQGFYWFSYSRVLPTSFPGPFPWPTPKPGKRPWERDWCFTGFLTPRFPLVFFLKYFFHKRRPKSIWQMQLKLSHQFLAF